MLGTVPPHQRCDLLRTLRRLLKLDGFLITNMLARFSPGALSPADNSVPVLFRDSNYTKAPSSVVVFHNQGTVDTPLSATAPQKVVFALL